MTRLICFGDSITAGHEGHEEPLLTKKIAEALPDYEILNKGVSGNNTNDAIRRIDRDVLSHNPDIVTVLFGANDAAFHKMVPLSTYKNNLREIVRKIYPSTCVLLTPTPVDETKQFKRTNSVLEEYAEAVSEVAREMKCPLIDVFSTMIRRKDYPYLVKGQQDDGLHIGEAGYAVLCQLIVQTLREI